MCLFTGVCLATVVFALWIEFIWMPTQRAEISAAIVKGKAIATMERLVAPKHGAVECVISDKPAKCK